MGKIYSKFSIGELKIMKIFEYNPNLGTFSLGFERFSQNEVVEVLNIDKKALYSYNYSHKRWFLPNFDNISSYKLQNDVDLAILKPNIGDKIARRGSSNFKIQDILDCLTFLEREKPKFSIILMSSEAIQHLNIAKSYVRDGFNELSKDIIVQKLQKMGYKVYLVALDEASYGVATHKFLALYIATPPDFDLKFPAPMFNEYGRGKYNRFRTISDAISDLGPLNEWSPYEQTAQNVYQRSLRRSSEDHTTWHFLPRKLNASQIATISSIPQGSKAKKVKTVKPNAGYIRPKWDRICPRLDEKFYLTSSTAVSIHPIQNRPFTMREGMRIMGIPDNISFELSLSYRDAAHMVVQSVSPIIGQAAAMGVQAIQ